MVFFTTVQLTTRNKVFLLCTARNSRPQSVLSSIIKSKIRIQVERESIFCRLGHSAFKTAAKCTSLLQSTTKTTLHAGMSMKGMLNVILKKMLCCFYFNISRLQLVMGLTVHSFVVGHLPIIFQQRRKGRFYIYFIMVLATICITPIMTRVVFVCVFFMQNE